MMTMTTTTMMMMMMTTTTTTTTKGGDDGGGGVGGGDGGVADVLEPAKRHTHPCFHLLASAQRCVPYLSPSSSFVPRPSARPSDMQAHT
eukprot:2269255-Rhodomonas_salina.2